MGNKTDKIDYNEIFGFNGLEIIEYTIGVGTDGKETVHFYLKSKDSKRLKCPRCNSLNVYSHTPRKRELLDLPILDRSTMLSITLASFRCRECKRSYQIEIDDFAEKNAKLTNRLRDAIAKESALAGFTSAANRYGVSAATAKKTFNVWAKRLDFLKVQTVKAPEILGLDEAHLARNYRGVLVDVKKGRFIDLLPNREPETIKEYIENMEGLNKVRAVTSDMYKPYRKLIYELFGDDFTFIIDKFHVIQDLNRKVVKARSLIVRKNPGIKLGKNATLMKMNFEDLKDKQKEELMNHFALVPELGILYALKESFRTIYNCNNKKEALKKYESWCASIPEKEEVIKDDNEQKEKAGKKQRKTVDRFDPIRSFKKSVDEFKKEIFAWFDMNFTNAPTEAINGLIKKVNSNGRGYGFEVLRKKLMYGLTPSYVPTDDIFGIDDLKEDEEMELLMSGEIGMDESISRGLSPRIVDLIKAIDNGVMTFTDDME